MEYKELGIGNKINMLRVKDAAGLRTEPKQYVSQLLDIDVTNRIAKVAMPIENKVIVPLEVGDIYRIVIYTSNGLYQCMSKIMKRYKEGSLYVLDILFIGKLEKYQRRQYYRLMCDISLEHRSETNEEVTLRELLVNDEFESDNMRDICQKEFDSLVFEWEEGATVDISGGGIRFKSTKEYSADDIIVLNIPVVRDGEGNIVPIQAKVLKCTKDYDGVYVQYDIRAEFYNVDSKTREKLVRYIFDEQRRRMKR